MKNFKQQLFELLTIQAPSRQEAKVRTYLQPRLGLLVDKMFVDKKGNLLAEKKVGTGEGATIMLSAHMDSVANIQKGRQVKFDEFRGAFYSTKGVLGADDRAGIAIIMTVLRNIDKIDFNGNIKIAFCVEEEIGCVGSDAMDVNWYSDVNLAIVVDRRGSRDIVTGCGSPWNFCSKAVGDFLENCSALLGMDWESVGGGVSDAMTFSSNGVHSVNLSAGYYNEHTNKEYVVVKESQDTINLILQAFALVNGFYKNFGEIPKGYTRDSWYSSKSYGSWTGSKWNTGWEDSDDASWTYDEKTIFEQTGNRHGNVTVTDVAGFIAIHQDGGGKYTNQEIWMDRSDFRDMVNSYLKSLDIPTVENFLKAKMEVKKSKAKEANKVKAEAPKAGVAGKHFIADTKGALVEVKA